MNIQMIDPKIATKKKCLKILEMFVALGLGLFGLRESTPIPIPIPIEFGAVPPISAWRHSYTHISRPLQRDLCPLSTWLHQLTIIAVLLYNTNTNQRLWIDCY